MKTKIYHGHLAVDVYQGEGDIKAIYSGIVEYVHNRESGGNGYMVAIKHTIVKDNDITSQQTFYSSYSHLSKITTQEGKLVHVGQNIGVEGKTGWNKDGTSLNFSAHLHLAIYYGNLSYGPAGRVKQYADDPSSYNKKGIYIIKNDPEKFHDKAEWTEANNKLLYYYYTNRIFFDPQKFIEEKGKLLYSAI